MRPGRCTTVHRFAPFDRWISERVRWRGRRFLSDRSTRFVALRAMSEFEIRSRFGSERFSHSTARPAAVRARIQLQMLLRLGKQRIRTQLDDTDKRAMVTDAASRSVTSRRIRVSDSLLEMVDVPVSEPLPSRVTVRMDVRCELHARGTYGRSGRKPPTGSLKRTMADRSTRMRVLTEVAVAARMVLRDPNT